MNNKTINVHISKNAQKQLNDLAEPLSVELEMYFSCLIRLRVVFPEKVPSDCISLKSNNDKLKLFFHPIMTKHCNVSDIRGRDPDTETFPIQRPEKFIPKWLKLDYKNGQWMGEYGYAKG